PCSSSIISSCLDVERSYLVGILRKLVHAGLLSTTLGTRGGFALRRAPCEITLLQIIQAADGPIVSELRVRPEQESALVETLRTIWERAAEERRTYLAMITVESLVMASAALESHRESGACTYRPRRGSGSDSPNPTGKGRGGW